MERNDWGAVIGAGRYESVIVKVELEICHGCLSSDRDLMALGENTELFNYLLGSDGVEDSTSISLCWECSAMLRNTRRFQQRIQMAQDIMRQNLNLEELYCLSTLTRRTKIETCSNMDSVHIYSNNTERETSTTGCTRNTTDSFVYQDIQKHQPVVKLEKIEIKFENKHNSDMDLDGVEMESVLKEKEENLEHITLDRPRSPSNTTDSSITGGTLLEDPGLDDVNEMKTGTGILNAEHVKKRLNKKGTGEPTKAISEKRKPNSLKDGINSIKDTIPNNNSSYFACDSCSYVTSLECRLIRHVKSHENKKCHVCNKKFASTSDLKVHSSVHTGEKPYSCEICGKKFTHSSSLKYHISKHTGKKPYSCEICCKKFIQNSDLVKHQRVHTDEKPYSCEICGKKFTHPASLKYHVSKHTGKKKYSCETCGKKFIHKWNLNGHQRVHGEKPYSCEICGKKFTASGMLQTHVRIHTGEKPYSCEICGKKFIQKGNLNEHQRVHTGEKPYSCKICGKKFGSSGVLKKHERVHTGERPYSCEICGKKFIQDCHLINHQRVHTGEKPYSCEICGKKFTQLSSMKLHFSKHELLCM